MTVRRPFLKSLSQRIRRWNVLEEAFVFVAYGAIKILAALPSRWILNLSDALASVYAFVDRRGRKAASQNLRVAFGDAMDSEERYRIFKASCRDVLRAVLLLLHLQPLTPRRFQQWVDTPDFAEAEEAALIKEKGGVFVSGHIGNWELLLGLRVLFPDFPPSVMLAEQIPHAAMNKLLKKLRSHGDLQQAFRKGGARAIIHAVSNGGTGAVLIDRNVRRQQGGVWAPFLGLPARTSPLPAWIGLRYDVPVFPIFCFPKDDGRYRLWLGPNVMENLEAEEEQARIVEILTRINAVFEDIIRAKPELWNWTLKRWKSRPEVELGRYPPYSFHDP